MPDIKTTPPRTRRAPKPFEGTELRSGNPSKPKNASTKAEPVKKSVKKLKIPVTTRKKTEKKTTVTLKSSKKVSTGLSDVGTPLIF